MFAMRGGATPGCMMPSGGLTVGAVPAGNALAPSPLTEGGRSLSVLHVFAYFRPDFTGEGLYFEKLARHLARMGIARDVVAARTRRW